MTWKNLTAESHQWRDKCLQFGREVVAPRYARYDEENRFPSEIHALAHEAGIPNADFSQDLGGQGLSDVDSVIGVEALASTCAATAFTLGFNRGALQPILAAGTLEQKQEFIGRLIRERRYASLCLTERSAGSNLMETSTVAVRTQRGWILNGEKVMVGNGTVSTQYQVLARAEENGKFLGLTFFIVPRQEGVVVGPNSKKLGFRAVETPTIRFEEVELRDEHRLGQVGSGASVMLDTLHAIRVGGAATILGIVVGTLRELMPWVREREVYGGALINKSHIQLALGDFYGRLELVRGMVLEAARLRQQGEPCGHASSIAKLYASELALDVTAEAV